MITEVVMRNKKQMKKKVTLIGEDMEYEDFNFSVRLSV